MYFIGDLFSSRARVQILSAMTLLENPVGIRSLSRIADVPLRSAQLAVQGLCEEGVLNVSKTPKKPEYSLNMSNPVTNRLNVIFRADLSEVLRSRSPELHAKASALCPFLEEAEALVHHGRKSLNEPL